MITKLDTVKCDLKKKIRLWLTVIAVSLQLFCCSAMTTWSSTAIPKLKEEGVVLGEREISALGNYYLGGMLASPVVSYILLTKLGRKPAMIISSVLILASTSLLFSVSLPGLLYFGRFIGGISFCAYCAVIPAFQAECFHANERQTSGGTMSLFFTLGVLSQYVLAPFISYNLNIIIMILPDLIFLAIVTVLCEESPVVLLKRGNELKAKIVMNSYWSLHEPEDRITEEIENMKISLEEEANLSTLEAFKSIFTVKSNLKSTANVCFLLIAEGLCGFYQILMYMQMILIYAETPYSSRLCSAIVGIFKLIGGILSPLVVNKIGVKWTLVVSLFGNVLSMVSLGVYFFMKDKYFDISNIYWLPVASVAVCLAFTMIGSMILPFTLRGEILHPNIRPLVVPFSDFLASAFSIISNILFFNEFHQLYVAFWVFAAVTIVQIIFVTICLPDTRHLTLSEIQNLLE